MKEIQIFSSPQFGDLRIIEVKQKLYSCLTDVCNALHLKNVSQVRSRLQEDGVIINEVIDTMGRSQKANFVSEPNFYRCLFLSRKREADEFQKWVYEDVLPSIRKTGGYMIAKDNETPEEIMARALRVADDTLKRREERIKALEVQTAQQTEQIAQQQQELTEVKTENEQLKQRQTYMDVVLACKSTVIVTSIAQDYGMTAKAFNILLRNYGVQHKVGGQWILYGKYLDKGYVNAKPVEITHKSGVKSIKYNTEWTQQGRFFIYNTLKQHGVLPLIERETA